MDPNIILYFVVDADGTEVLCDERPQRILALGYWNASNMVSLPPGTIKKWTGEEPPTWENNEYVTYVGDNYDPSPD